MALVAARAHLCATGAVALRWQSLGHVSAPAFGQTAGVFQTRPSSSSSSSGKENKAAGAEATASGPAAENGGETKYAVCLPQTTMEMRANASTREPMMHRLWEGLFDWQAARHHTRTFILHDGPPFANGKPHMGHFLNKTLKDITCRYHILKGHRVSFTPGWDCHGLPIEQKAMEAAKVKEAGPADIRARCKQFAEAAIAQQAAAFRRWGVLADWERPYLTMAPHYEATQLHVFHDMFAKGLIYRGYKPVFWSPSSRTALAEAELEYHDHESKSVYIRFPLHPSQQLLSRILTSADGTSGTNLSKIACLVWTTTPWTIPANQALAINPTITYALVRNAETAELLVVAADLVGPISTKLSAKLETLTTIPGAEILDSTYKHPLLDRIGRILPSTHVTNDSGTGVVHMAPAHGAEDFQVCKSACATGPGGDAMGLDKVLSLVGEKGEYLTEAGPGLAGLPVLGAGNDKVIAMLQDSGSLAHVESFMHRYPYDWRTHRPVILRATQQWFADLTDIKSKAISALEDVKIYPDTGKSRLSSMLKLRNEWCISRQRIWGVPIPVFYEVNTDNVLFTKASFEHIVELVRMHGTDVWWNLPVEELLAPEYRSNGRKYVKGRDTMDVWFDSGSSWKAVIDASHPGHKADLYIEGSDQHRGWFQSSLLTRVSATHKKIPDAPYKTILTHGFVVDEQGRKMSKQLGNGIDPNDVITTSNSKMKLPPLGADVLRLWVVSSDFTKDVSIGATSLDTASKQHKKIRNTGRFLIGVLSDFDTKTNSVPYTKMNELDRFMLHLVAEFERTIDHSYENYAYLRVSQVITDFVGDISSFYFEVTKDRLYADAKDSQSRRAAQTVMHHIWDALTKSVTPIACHIGEELYNYRFGRDPAKDDACVSVMKSGWIHTEKEWHRPALGRKWDVIRAVRGAVYSAIDQARRGSQPGSQPDTGVVGSANAVAKVYASKEVIETLQTLNSIEGPGSTSSLLNLVFLTSSVELNVVDSLENKGEHSFAIDKEGLYGKDVGGWAEVQKTEKHKCPRCWTYTSARESALCVRCDEVVKSQ